MTRKVYIETYGCRMNICDSEIILSILAGRGYYYTDMLAEADLVVLNCCSVREIGHQKAFGRIEALEKLLRPQVTLVIAGCMATQLKEDFFETYPRVQIVVCPTGYESLPDAIEESLAKPSKHFFIKGEKADEIYDRRLPLRVLEGCMTAAVTVMKGCDQYCSYCIEPYTRGERVNRSYQSIMHEIADACRSGFHEITLFGHIVDLWQGEDNGRKMDFSQLLAEVAESYPSLRVKFISSHPATFTDSIAHVMQSHGNVMKVVHLPVQSGSDEVLARMNRRYTVKQFVDRVAMIRDIVPGIQIVTDVMVGFPGERQADFDSTLALLRMMRFTNVNVFAFSKREGTLAAQNYVDDVPEIVKRERIHAVRALVEDMFDDEMGHLVGSVQEVMAEQPCRQSGWWCGRDLYHRSICFKRGEGVCMDGLCKVRVQGVKDGRLYGECVYEAAY